MITKMIDPMLNQKIHEIENTSDAAKQALSKLDIYNLGNLIEGLESKLHEGTVDKNEIERLLRCMSYVWF